jgi:hypothetical protein
MYEIRRAERASGESHAPYAIPTSRRSSQRRGKGKFSFRTNAALAFTESKEIPRICVFAFSKSAARSRNPRPSIVQPKVRAFGKNQRTTRRPR